MFLRMRMLFLNAVMLYTILFIPSINAKNDCMYPERHVILIGIDGARRDSFNKVVKQLIKQKKDTAFTGLITNGAIDNKIYAGGHLGDDTEQLTLSEPGWVTILTGAWAEHHLVKFNGDLARNTYNHQYPTIYNYVKNYLPNARVASFTDWQPMQILAGYTFYGDDAADINQYYPYQDENDLPLQDQKMTADVIKQINTAKPPAFIFVHFDNPDEAGHHHGFSSDVPQYMQAIQQEADNINLIVKAIQQAEKKNQQWLTIVTTDHGGHLNIHGTETASDRNIFSVFAAEDTLFSGGMHIALQRGQVVFVPTILDYLGVDICLSQLDGRKL